VKKKTKKRARVTRGLGREKRRPEWDSSMRASAEEKRGYEFTKNHRKRQDLGTAYAWFLKRFRDPQVHCETIVGTHREGSSTTKNANRSKTVTGEKRVLL